MTLAKFGIRQKKLRLRKAIANIHNQNNNNSVVFLNGKKYLNMYPYQNGKEQGSQACNDVSCDELLCEMLPLLSTA